MKNKKNLTTKDRRNYLTYQFKILYSDFLIMAILFIIVAFFVFKYFIPNISIDTINHSTLKFYYLAFHALIITIRFLFSNSFKVLFFKKIYTLDGHIFKKHTFINNNTHNSDKTTSFKSKARAISEDGGITTKWLYYPEKYFKKGNAKVKLIIYKNKAIDFYLVD